MVRYYLVAALLGGGWELVLLIPGTTREWLLMRPYLHLVLLAIASIIVAHLFRRIILGADGLVARIRCGALIPFAGSCIYLLLSVAVNWDNLHDSISVVVMGLLTTALSFYIVIPYGIFCQYALQWVVWRSESRDSLGE